MTIRHLKVFIKVCELGSITKAAEELCVAQPSISQTIKEIETYYSVILFNRVNKRLQLTSEGKLLLQKAKEVIDEFDDFEALANDKKLNPVINIGATMTFGEFLLPNYLDKLKVEIPECVPKFFIGKPSSLEEKISLGDLDFAFAEGLINSKSLKAHLLGKDTLAVVAGKEYKCPNSMNITDLPKYDLLLRETGSPSRRILDYKLAIKGIKLGKPRLESISNNVIISMTLNNKGIGIVPYALVKKYIDDGSLIEIKLDTLLERKLFLISHKNKKFNTLTKKAYNIAIKMGML